MNEPASSSDAGAPAMPDLALLPLMTMLLRYRLLILLGIMIGVGMNTARHALRPRTYTATAVVLPEGRGSNTLPQFPGQSQTWGDPTQSPAFYAYLATSDPVLARVVRRVYEWREDGVRRRGTLVERYGGSGNAYVRRRRAMAVVGGVIETSERLGTVTVDVTADQPRLAQSMAEALVAVLNEINVERRRAQALRERDFVAAGMSESETSLRRAEERLRAFMEANRDFANAPRLLVQQQRLSREVDRLQQLYIARAQAYEQARLDEVRNLPVLMVIAAPELPLGPDPRRLRRHALVGGIGGGMIVITLLALRIMWSHMVQRNSPGVAEFLREIHDVSHPLRRRQPTHRTGN